MGSRASQGLSGAALLLLLAVAAVLPAPASAARHHAPFCQTSDLGVTIGQTSAGAGQRFATVILRNGSARACRTRGYVGLLLLGRGGRALPTKVVRVQGGQVHFVRLQPGDRAFTDLRWGAIAGPGEPVDAPCEATPRRIEVTPPDETRQLVAGWHGGPVCEHGRIEVQPLRDKR